MSKELKELIKELGKIVDGNQSIVEELDKLKSLYKQLKVEVVEEFEYPFQENEKYWYVDEKGKVYGLKWDNKDFDPPRYDQGHIFKTEQEAKRERDKRVLLTRFRQFRDKCNGEWKPETYDCKFFISYDGSKNVLESGWNDVWDNFNTFGYFYDERDCLHAIEFFGDEIKRLWVEVD